MDDKITLLEEKKCVCVCVCVYMCEPLCVNAHKDIIKLQAVENFENGSGSGTNR
jgi:hypothetical protein